MNDSEVIDVLGVAVHAADEALGENPIAIDVRSQLALADVFLIVSADNQRHLRSLVDAVSRAVKEHFGRLPNVVEGSGTESGWIVVDYGDLVIHLFLEDEREYYALEKLWHACPQLDVTEYLLVEGA